MLRMEDTRLSANGSVSVFIGFVLRQCGDDGKWNSTVDVSNCSSGVFDDLQVSVQASVCCSNECDGLQEDTLFSLTSAYNEVELNAEVVRFIRRLNITTQPKMGAHFPRDLETISSLIELLIGILAERPLPSIHTVGA